MKPIKKAQSKVIEDLNENNSFYLDSQAEISSKKSICDLKYNEFIKRLAENKEFLLKLEKLGITSFYEKLINNKHNAKDLLNLFEDDIDLTLNNINQIINYAKRCKLINLSFSKHISSSIEDINLLSFIGFDKCKRPIVGISFKNINFNLNPKLFYYKNIIDNMDAILIKFDIIYHKTVTLLIDIADINDLHVLHGFEDFIKLFQLLYPSKFHRIYVDTKRINSIIINYLLFNYNRERVYHFQKASEEIDATLVNSFYNDGISNKQITTELINYSLNNSFGKSLEKFIEKEEEISNIEIKLNFTASNKKNDLDYSKNHFEYSVNGTYRRNNLTKDNSTSFEVININKFTSKLSIHVENNLKILGNNKKETKNIIILESNKQSSFCSFDSCLIF